MQRQYSTQKWMRKGLAFLLVLVVAAAAWYGMLRAGADAQQITCWAMCKPGSRINIHMTPSEGGIKTGYLECGDTFQTDAEERDGWIRCYGAGENGWIYCGYVSMEPVQQVGQRYVCVAKRQVACRRWMNGPQIENNKRKQWLKNGENVQVFCMGDGWAVTSKGYIQSEWLEVDPE